MRIILYGKPITKKNSQRIIAVAGKPRIIPSLQYKLYESSCLKQIGLNMDPPINTPVNMQCVYYMPTKRSVDLVNLLEATCDILVRADVITDDNCRIVAGHDGSRVLYDKDNPRVEITITEMET